MQVRRSEYQTDAHKQIFPEQTIAKMVDNATFDFGYSETSLVRCRYDSGALILCHRAVEEWVRCLEPNEVRLFTIPDYVLRASADELNLQTPSVEARPRLEDARINCLIGALEADAKASHLAGSLYTESVTFALATALLQQNGKSTHALPAARGALTPSQFRRVRDFVMAHLDRNIGLIEMGAVVDLSPSYFSTLFRRASGSTPHAYVMQERMKRARHLLGTSKMKVLDVAIDCGFRSQQHFARVFRRQSGASPTDYVRQTERHRTPRPSPLTDAKPTGADGQIEG